MTSALDMCHAARRAWERSQPQMTLDVDRDDEEPQNTTGPRPQFSGGSCAAVAQEES